MLASGFRLTQDDQIDSRFNNYLLEHSYRWLRHEPGHESLWDPAFCFPAGDMLAHSDVMISFAPAYWFWRVRGFEADTSFQLWMVTVAVANFLAGYALLRHGIQVGIGGAWCGAVLFAAAGSRAAQLGHPQLYCQVFILVALYALTRMSSGGPRAILWMLLATAAIALQFWGGFYLAFFVAMAVSIGLAWRLVLAGRQTVSRPSARAIGLGIVLSLAAMSAALAPLAIRYGHVACTTAMPGPAAISAMLPTPKSWYYMGSGNLLYGRFDPAFADLSAPEEQAIGLGLITTAIAGVGLWIGRRRLSFRLVALAAATLIVLTTRFGEHASLWWLVRDYIPGAAALRAVSRVGLLMTIPAAIGVAAFVDRFKSRAVYLVFGLCLLEQVHRLPAYDKWEVRDRVWRIAAAIPPNTDAFFYFGTGGKDWASDQVDAMWASLQSGVPTINGYSGAWPPGSRELVTSPNRAALEKWMKQNHLAGRNVIVLSREGDLDNFQTQPKAESLSPPAPAPPR
ncbi:MAG TPA: hypothetical protein VK797_26725 [Tepidisphaeraceae bacterium]|nr:hypothetical protein [Tepidisphaeraceae bacterium]